MTKRGVPQTAVNVCTAGKAAQPRALRSRKRKFPGSEESGPAGDNESLQSGEAQGSSVCMRTSSGVEECSALLSKDVKATDSCREVKCPPSEVKLLNLDCTPAQRERGASASFQTFRRGSSVPDQGGGAGDGSLALSDTKRAVRPVLEGLNEKLFTDNEMGAKQQRENGHEGWMDEGAEIQEYPSAVPSYAAPCPPGSPQHVKGRELGRGARATDGVMGMDGEKEKPTDGTGDRPSDQPLLGEGSGTVPEAEPLRSATGGQCEDGPAKKKVRKRMGMRGFGERERRTHCEGQLASRNQKKGESKKEREREGKVDRKHEESHSDCHDEVTGKTLEMANFNMAANGTHLWTTEGMPDTTWALVSQPAVLPSATDIFLPTPLDSILEEEEVPSQSGMEGSYKIPKQPLTVEKTVAGETKSSHSAMCTGSVDTSPCGPGEASAEEDGPGASGGGSGASRVELGGAACQVWGDAWRSTGNPCAVQEEDCDLTITVLGLEEVLQNQGRRGPSWAQRREAPKVRACSSSEPAVSLGPNALESGTVAIPCDGVARSPFEGLLDPNGLVVSETTDEVKRMGATVGTGLASCGPAEPLWVEFMGQGSSQGCASLFQGDPMTNDFTEPPELEEEPHGHTEDSMKMSSHEPAPVTETKEAPAPGHTGARASPEEHQHPTAHCVTVSVDVHTSPANHTEAQRTSGQASLGVSNVDPDQHQDRGDGVLQNTVSSHDVQETGSGHGRQGPVCASVLPPICEDKTLPWDTVLVHSFNTQSFAVRSPKPCHDPDTGPEPPISPSDSQLNNIALSEMEDSPTPDCADRQEDASELVCGLIKELSFLNRTVMAAHRELDNIRRGNRTPKPPLRRSYGSRRSEM
ncbi:hypothetical protein SKAU_G00118720 [Synaphobranchus kaupii]|uniref:Uncharacterized protein n=1 Tax=Synaphobranchus kaupii TaxID=118154 RepID=A0A9Q1FN41_SYNKA|nr:hypothetical protein SKAU_G00118720 [Synaphobranchus kaupii]